MTKSPERPSRPRNIGVGIQVHIAPQNGSTTDPTPGKGHPSIPPTLVWCENCEQRLDLCHCTPDTEFEALLEEPDDEEQLHTFDLLSRPAPSSIMIRTRIRPKATPRRLRRPTCWGC